MDKEKLKKDDPFFVDAEKFVSMLEFVKSVRDAQNQYLSTKSQTALQKSKELEARLNKALAYCLANKNKINDIPF